MQRFIIEENIRRFHRLLEQALEPDQRRMVEDLLAAEEANLDLSDRLPAPGADEDARRQVAADPPSPRR